MQRLEGITVYLTIAFTLALAISLAWDVSQGPGPEQTPYLAALGVVYAYYLGAFCLCLMVGFGLQFWVIRSTGPSFRRLGILCLIIFVLSTSTMLCIVFAHEGLTPFRDTSPISLPVPNTQFLINAAPIANGASIVAALFFLSLCIFAIITRLRRRGANS